MQTVGVNDCQVYSFMRHGEETRLAVEQKDTKINKSKPKKHTKSQVQFMGR
jgi:hypothetical protein